MNGLFWEIKIRFALSRSTIGRKVIYQRELSLKFFSFSSLSCPRQLCVSALVEEGDANGDKKIGFEEFRTLLSHHYKPSSKGERELKFNLKSSNSIQFANLMGSGLLMEQRGPWSAMDGKLVPRDYKETQFLAPKGA